MRSHGRLVTDFKSALASGAGTRMDGKNTAQNRMIDFTKRV